MALKNGVFFVLKSARACESSSQFTSVFSLFILFSGFFVSLFFPSCAVLILLFSFPIVALGADFQKAANEMEEEKREIT